jgi:hypothetical protein
MQTGNETADTGSEVTLKVIFYIASRYGGSKVGFRDSDGVLRSFGLFEHWDFGFENFFGLGCLFTSLCAVLYCAGRFTQCLSYQVCKTFKALEVNSELKQTFKS